MANNNPNIEQSASQNRAIAKWLQDGHTITPLEALRQFGCMRLTSRIWDIKTKFGMEIKKRLVTMPNGKRVAEYSINQ